MTAGADDSSEVILLFDLERTQYTINDGVILAKIVHIFRYSYPYMNKVFSQPTFFVSVGRNRKFVDNDNVCSFIAC